MERICAPDFANEMPFVREASKQFGLYDSEQTIPLSAHGFDVLDTCAGVEENDFFVAMDIAALNQLSQSRQTSCAFGRDEQSFRRADLYNSSEQLLVADCDRRSAGLAKRIEDEEITDGLRNAQSRCNRCRIAELIGMRGPRLECSHDWRASLRLHAHHSRTL